MSATLRKPDKATANVIPLVPDQPLPTPITEKQVWAWIESGKPVTVPNALITKPIASLLLQFNAPGRTNRRVNDRFLRQTINAINRGLWKNTGEPVIMSSKRILNDGQHRLLAVVAADRPVVMDLRFGVEREAFETTNSGRSRSSIDVLRMMDTPYFGRVSAAARMVLAYRDGLPQAMRESYGTAEIVNAVKEWPELAAAAAELYDLGGAFQVQRDLQAAGERMWANVHKGDWAGRAIDELAPPTFPPFEA